GGSIPVGARWIEESESTFPTGLAHGSPEPRVDLLSQHLAVQTARLQVPPHCVLHQYAVLAAPRCGRLTEHPVFPRTGAEAGDAGVDAARVRLQQRSVGRGGRSYDLARHRAEAEQTGLAVLSDRHPAEELRELAGREPPREIHLEKAVLAVHEAGRVGEINPIGGLDGRDPKRVSTDAHRGA